MFVILTGTTGMLSGVAAATGEEIGWRGFLVPELAKVLPFTAVALVSGLIWAAWHYPIAAVVYRDAGLSRLVLVWLTFTFVAVVAVVFWLKRGGALAWPSLWITSA